MVVHRRPRISSHRRHERAWLRPVERGSRSSLRMTHEGRRWRRVLGQRLAARLPVIRAGLLVLLVRPGTLLAFRARTLLALGRFGGHRTIRRSRPRGVRLRRGVGRGCDGGAHHRRVPHGRRARVRAVRMGIHGGIRRIDGMWHRRGAVRGALGVLLPVGGWRHISVRRIDEWEGVAFRG